MTSTHSVSSEERNNASLPFLLLHDVCAEQLRAVLRKKIKPKAFAKVIKEKYHRLPPLPPESTNMIMPTSGEYNSNYVEFDITLLYTLLSNICELPPPKKGWNKPPDADDVSLSACIERIHLARNKICHLSQSCLSSSELNIWWSSVRLAVAEMDKFLGNKNIYTQKMDEIRKTVVNQEMLDFYKDQASKHYEVTKLLLSIYRLEDGLQEKKRNKISDECVAFPFQSDTYTCPPNLTLIDAKVEDDELILKYKKSAEITSETSKESRRLFKCISLNENRMDEQKFKIYNFKTPNKGIKVSVTLETLSAIQVDAVITLSGCNLNMTAGHINRSLVRIEGEKLEQYLKDNYAFGLSPGQVADIPAANLPYRRIYIGVLPDYNQETFQQIIANCLHMSTGRKVKSLGIPCVEDKSKFLSILQKALDVIINYDKILSRTTVEDICIIVENEDIELYNDILRLLLTTTNPKIRCSEALRNFCSWPKPQITAGILDYEFILNDISVCLLKDDILEVQADAIVNSTNALLDLNSGQLSKMILRRCGQNLVQECLRKRLEMIKNKVVATSAYELIAHNIIHMTCCYAVHEWLSRCLTVFDIARNLKCSSLALPLFGTGCAFIPFDVETMCELILVSLSIFTLDNTSHGLQKVKIVAYKDTDFTDILSFFTKISQHCKTL